MNVWIFLLKIIVLIFFIIILIIRLIEISYIKKNSIYYKQIQALNNKYQFYLAENNIEIVRDVASKKQLESFDMTLAVYDIISHNEYVSGMLYKINYNRKEFSKYDNEFKEVLSNIKCYRFKFKIINAWVANLEKKICLELKEYPIRKFNLYFKIYYMSPKGRNYYCKEKNYAFDNLERIYNYYREKEHEKSVRDRLIKNERALVTDSLRYEVLKRDNFRCKACGAGPDDGVKLHVDHIIPVSKGGKTELSNLQTLCERCNIGKGNKL